MVFDKIWFGENQKTLLRLANGKWRRFFRYGFGLQNDVPQDKDVTEISPNYCAYKTGEDRYRYIFKVKNYHALCIYKTFWILWAAMHAWDWFADAVCPKLSFGFSTWYHYWPDPHPETTTVDGFARAGVYKPVGPYDPSGGRLWNDPTTGIINAAGDSARDNASPDSAASMRTGSVNNKWLELIRGLFLFDISSLPVGVAILNASFWLHGDIKQDNDSLGNLFDINVFSCNPTSNTAIVGGDFSTFGNTAYSTAINYGALACFSGNPNAGWNEWVLNATGISFLQAAQSGSGIVRLGTRTDYYDAQGHACPTNGVQVQTFFNADFSESGTGTYGPPPSLGPRLDIEVSTQQTKTLTESITQTDKLIRPVFGVESFTLTDKLLRPLYFVEQITGTDTLTSAILKIINLVESFSLTEFLTKVKTAIGIWSDEPGPTTTWIDEW